jgi:hypothetical protein
MDMYAREKNNIRILYGFIPSLPTIPARITLGPRHCAAQRMAMARMGAVVRLMGIWLGSRWDRGRRMRTGTITKKIEIMKTTNVAIAEPLTMEAETQESTRGSTPTENLMLGCYGVIWSYVVLQKLLTTTAELSGYQNAVSVTYTGFSCYCNFHLTFRLIV